MVRQRRRYDEDLLVEMIAEGQLTYAQMGRQLGISESLIKKIARGRRRRELLRRIWDIEDGMLSEARRVGSRYARNLIMEQVRLGLTGQGEPARRAREFVLKFAISARPKRSDLPSEATGGPDWMVEQMEQLGIPRDQEEQDGEDSMVATAQPADEGVEGPSTRLPVAGALGMSVL